MAPNPRFWMTRGAVGVAGMRAGETSVAWIALAPPDPFGEIWSTATTISSWAMASAITATWAASVPLTATLTIAVVEGLEGVIRPASSAALVCRSRRLITGSRTSGVRTSSI